MAVRRQLLFAAVDQLMKEDELFDSPDCATDEDDTLPNFAKNGYSKGFDFTRPFAEFSDGSEEDESDEFAATGYSWQVHSVSDEALVRSPVLKNRQDATTQTVQNADDSVVPDEVSNLRLSSSNDIEYASFSPNITSMNSPSFRGESVSCNQGDGSSTSSDVSIPATHSNEQERKSTRNAKVDSLAKIRHETTRSISGTRNDSKSKSTSIVQRLPKSGAAIATHLPPPLMYHNSGDDTP